MKQSRLGLIDWGIGGIGVYTAIQKSLGNVPVVYFSDTGATPYGKMRRDDLAERLDSVIEFLKTRLVTHVVIGCNSASTALGDLKDHCIPIEGVIDSGVSAALKKKPTRLGLIGGRRTVLSGVYRRAFAAKGVRLDQRIAQPLSGLIESGDLISEDLRSECRQILRPLRSCSHILLACTHYPAIEPILKEYVPKGTEFVDPAAELVKRVAKWEMPRDGESEFLTSGSIAAMRRSAKLAFGFEIKNARRVKI